VVARVPGRVVDPSRAGDSEAGGLLTACALFVCGGLASLSLVVAVLIPSLGSHHCHGATRSAQEAKAERAACLRLGITPEEYRARQVAGEGAP